ncbi:MAG: hypothetical protein Q9187_009716 [Circinaria calcarea]
MKTESSSTNVGPTPAVENVPGVQSVGDPSSAPQPEFEHQGASRLTDEPSATEIEAIKADKERVEKFDEQAGREPDLTGIESNDRAGVPLPRAQGVSSSRKSTGLAADGGDFDAAKPGAGQEAERLRSEKGLGRELSPATPDPALGELPVEDESTRGKMSRLKEKLRLGS